VIKSETLYTGFPDRLLLAPQGRFALVELKAPGGALRKGQVIVCGWLAKLGFTVHVLDHPTKVQEFYRRWLD